ncbi:hypothetical protein ACN28S_06990 [Cystobacter fuscus]
MRSSPGLRRRSASTCSKWPRASFTVARTASWRSVSAGPTPVNWPSHSTQCSRRGCTSGDSPSSSPITYMGMSTEKCSTKFTSRPSGSAWTMRWANSRTRGSMRVTTWVPNARLMSARRCVCCGGSITSAESASG